MRCWVTTHVTIGENRTEAILYGIVLWATTSVLLLWLTANGIQAGMNIAMTSRNADNSRAAVVTNNPPTAATSNLAEQQQNATRGYDAGREGAWWAFSGILLSMFASIHGPQTPNITPPVAPCLGSTNHWARPSRRGIRPPCERRREKGENAVFSLTSHNLPTTCGSAKITPKVRYGFATNHVHLSESGIPQSC